MKMRALPQSFWQQPNNANPLSPGAVYSRLPPLPGQAPGHEEDLLDHVPNLQEVAGEEAEQMMRGGEHRVTEANTDLLFSLCIVPPLEHVHIVPVQQQRLDGPQLVGFVVVKVPNVTKPHDTLCLRVWIHSAGPC